LFYVCKVRNKYINFVDSLAIFWYNQPSNNSLKEEFIMKMVRMSRGKGKTTKVNKSRAKKKVKLWKGGKKQMETIQNCIMRATVVEGQYAEDIRQALLRPPSPTALARNKRAQELLRKLRR